MRKKIAIAAAILVLSLASCACPGPAERATAARLQDQQEKVFSKYAVYVGQDPKLDAKAKDDELKLIQSLRDMTTSLRNSLEK